MKRTREMETGRTGSETKRTSAEVPDAGRTDQSENSPKSGEEEVGPGVGRAEDGLVGDGSRFRHTVLEKGVHSFTSTSPDLHLEI